MRDKREEKTPENDNIIGDTTQSSRSDKWKAKHEAMLKLAVGPKQNKSSGSVRNDTDGSSEESEEREAASHSEKHVFENRNLVITIKDALKENTENQSVKEKDAEERRAEKSKAKSSERTSKSKSSDSKKDVTRLTTRSMKPVFAL